MGQSVFTCRALPILPRFFQDVNRGKRKWKTPDRRGKAQRVQRKGGTVPQHSSLTFGTASDKVLKYWHTPANIRRSLFQKPLPMEDSLFNKLGSRESQIMSIVYRLEEADAETIRAELPDNLSNSSVRTMLRLLEEKGYLDHRQEGRRYIYFPAQPKVEVRRSMLEHLTNTFFDGSASEAAFALLSTDEELSPELLDELERRIDEAQSETSSDKGDEEKDTNS